MKPYFSFTLVLLLIGLYSCSSGIEANKELLIGKWKVVDLELTPTSDDIDRMSSSSIGESFNFKSDGSLEYEDNVTDKLGNPSLGNWKIIDDTLKIAYSYKILRRSGTFSKTAIEAKMNISVTTISDSRMVWEHKFRDRMVTYTLDKVN